ncbi:MAG TPA: hypothetical protein VNC79_01055, partial [Mycobacteriales bacterium]|nr:hypothetical protein [Mycobacteriales bacterium]
MAGTGPAARRNVALVGGAVLLVVAAYLALPSDPARAGIWALAGIAAAVVVLRHTARADDSLPGWLLAAGISLLTVGQAVTLVGSESPSYADVPRLLAYPVLAAAVTAFQRDRIQHDRDSLLDALVVTVAAAQVGWLV